MVARQFNIQDHFSCYYKEQNCLSSQTLLNTFRMLLKLKTLDNQI